MSSDEVVRLFGLNNVLIEHEIRRVESELDVDFGHRSREMRVSESDVYYPQFPARLRDEARRMAVHYEIFYCLENDMRQLITGRLLEKNGPEWRAFRKTFRTRRKKILIEKRNRA